MNPARIQDNKQLVRISSHKATSVMNISALVFEIAENSPQHLSI
jgi:hypothetical protein